MLKVCAPVKGLITEKYNPTIINNINTDPNRVYKKNFIAAYSRLAPPQIPIKK